MKSLRAGFLRSDPCEGGFLALFSREMQRLIHTLNVRSGERQYELAGSPVFLRQSAGSTGPKPCGCLSSYVGESAMQNDRYKLRATRPIASSSLTFLGVFAGKKNRHTYRHIGFPGSIESCGKHVKSKVLIFSSGCTTTTLTQRVSCKISEIHYRRCTY